MSRIITSADKEENPTLRGLYSPSLGQVGCVLLASAFGISDRRVNTIFGAEDWFVSPVDDMIMMAAPMSDWQAVKDMPRSERPGPEHFARIEKLKLEGKL